ncbi:MAG: tetratricopeptide repeat protein, partial [Myxococcales bacterium]|nr:tetratricopeptide repeat protein [Myxococcales bacterium]
ARRGDHRAALAAYRRALARCREARDCVLSKRRIAETLEQLGRYSEALPLYQALADDKREPHTAARAAQRVGRLLARAGKRDAAAAAWRHCLLRWAEEAAAIDCLADLVRQVEDNARVAAGGSTKGADRAVLALLVELEPKVRGRFIGSHVLWRAAELYRRHGQRHDAIKRYDALVALYPKSGLRDDALWFAGKLLEQSGDLPQALRRYRWLLRGRKEAWMVGSYYNQYMDNAQLRIGRIYFERLKDLGRARAAFELLAHDFPSSLLRDDALLWLAKLEEQAGRKKHACAALTELVKRYPDGNCVRRARAAATRLGCGSL